MFLLPQLVENCQSKINGDIQVYKFWGKYSIAVGNLTQSGGLVEQIWDKALKAVVRERVAANKILILGLGGGTAARLVKKYWPQARITGVDIDPVMVAMGEKYLGLAGITKIIADATIWLKQNSQQFDGILVDMYVGKNIPEAVTREEFLLSIKRTVTDGGWIVFNRLKTKEMKEENAAFRKRLEGVFGRYEIINTPVNELLLVKL